MKKISYWNHQDESIMDTAGMYVGTASSGHSAAGIVDHHNTAVDEFLKQGSYNRTENITGDNALSVPSIRGKARPVS